MLIQIQIIHRIVTVPSHPPTHFTSRKNTLVLRPHPHSSRINYTVSLRSIYTAVPCETTSDNLHVTGTISLSATVDPLGIAGVGNNSIVEGLVGFADL